MTTPADPGKQPPQGGDRSQPFTQELQYSNLSARIPEKVGRGVFATGAFVLQGPMEFAIDFVLRMNKPHQIVARVFFPINLMPQLIDTLKTSLEKYRKIHPHAATALTPPPNPAAPPAQQPAAAGQAGGGQAQPAVNVDEVYQDLKMSEDVMCGAYANALLIVHNVSDFCLDFMANLYPRAVITSRVFLSAPQVPILLNSLNQAWTSLQAKRQQQQHQPPKPPGPAAG